MEELGRGAFGAVYLAREPAAGREVAIKLLLDPHRKPKRLERFRREAQALARLDHPGIVRVHRADLEGGLPCLVMEFVRGRSLEEAAQDDLLLDDRLELLEQIAQAVGAAHAAGVVHRDLKPANVLVSDRDGRAKVTDFGLARDLDRDTRLTETGTMLGTPSFMAPEQVRGGDVGPACDVWALGVLAYWLLTDERPFQGETVIELCHQIMNSEPPRPSRVSKRLTPAHDQLCAAALQKDASKRPGAVELAEMAAAVRADPGVRSSPVSAVLAILVAVLSVGLAVALAMRGGDPDPAPASARAAPSAPPAPAPAPTTPAPGPTPTTRARPPTPSRTGPHAALWQEYDEAERRGEPDEMLAAATTILQRSPGSIQARVAIARGHDLALRRRTKVTRGLTSLLQEVAGRELSASDEEALATGRLLLAQYAFARGDQRACLGHLNEAVRLAPQSPTPRTRRGLLLLFSGRKNDAASGCREDLADAVKIGPNDPEALRNLATLRWDDGREAYTVAARRKELYAEAESLYASALKADPNDAEAYQLRAWLWRDQKRFADRDRDYDAALKLFRKGADRTGRFYLPAMQIWEQIEGCRNRAQGSRLFSDAQWAFNRATAHNRRHPLANAYAARMLLDYAASLLVRGADKNHPEVTRVVNAAVQKLSWARSVNGRCWEAAAWSAEALALVSKPPEALEEADAALALAPPKLRAIALRAKAAAQIAARRHEEALITLEITLGQRPRDWYASWLQSMALTSLNRRAEGEASLARARADLRW